MSPSRRPRTCRTPHPHPAPIPPPRPLLAGDSGTSPTRGGSPAPPPATATGGSPRRRRGPAPTSGGSARSALPRCGEGARGPILPSQEGSPGPDPVLPGGEEEPGARSCPPDREGSPGLDRARRRAAAPGAAAARGSGRPAAAAGATVMGGGWRRRGCKSPVATSVPWPGAPPPAQPRQPPRGRERRSGGRAPTPGSALPRPSGARSLRPGLSALGRAANSRAGAGRPGEMRFSPCTDPVGRRAPGKAPGRRQQQGEMLSSSVRRCRRMSGGSKKHLWEQRAPLARGGCPQRGSEGPGGAGAQPLEPLVPMPPAHPPL